MGSAVWLSTDPLQSLLYNPSEKHTKKLLMAKVIPGNSYQGICKHACDQLEHEPERKVYDTVVDGHVIIAYDTTLILPCYILTVTEIH